jgi:photosystem II stability/assembly factor-like uncharacterized protein
METNLNKNRTRHHESVVQLLLSLCLTAYGSCALGHHPHDVIDALAISPSYAEDKTLYIANSRHLLKSGNGGYSWKELSNGLDNSAPVSSVAFAPSRGKSSTLFVSTLGNGIYRSTDDGASWQDISANLKNPEIREISVRSDSHVLAIDTTGGLHVTHDSGQIWTTAVVPEDTLITALSQPVPFATSELLAGDSLGRILLSKDNGVSWKIETRLPGKTAITEIAFNPSDTTGSAYYIGTMDSGLYRTSDKGISFEALDNGLTADHIISLTFSPDFVQDRTILVTTWREAAFMSSDGGESWTSYEKGLTTSKQADTDKYRSPHFRQLQIVRDDSETMFLAGFDGLFKSSNGGRNWHELETRPVNLIKGLDLSPSHNGLFSIAIATYGGGAYISHDQGASWVIGNKGLRKTRLGDIKFSPLFPEDHTLFTGSMSLLLKSTDKGSSWEQIPLHFRSLRKRIINKLIALGVPKSVGWKYLTSAETLLVYPTAIALSPDYANDKTVYFGTRVHGMYRSEDSGHSSKNIWENAKGAITSLAISPVFSKDHTLFLYARGDGIYKTTDRGDSWRRINVHPFAENKSAELNSLLEHSDILLVFSPGYDEDQTLFAATPIGLFKSVDQGENWNKLENDTLGPAPHILGIGISPNYAIDDTLLISVKGHGLFKSLDGGQNFSETAKALREDNHSIELIVFSKEFSKDNTVFAASDESLFRSADRGDTWTTIQRPARYEDRRDAIRYEGNWIKEESAEYSASTVHYSTTEGAKATLDFFGCGIRWIASKSPNGGTANVYIDNSLVDTIALYAKKPEHMVEVFATTGMSCNPHRIDIELAGEDSVQESVPSRITLDAFDVLALDNLPRDTQND